MALLQYAGLAGALLALRRGEGCQMLNRADPGTGYDAGLGRYSFTNDRPGFERRS